MRHSHQAADCPYNLVHALGEKCVWRACEKLAPAAPVDPHCASCTCGKRAPVQGNRKLGKGPGTISWAEHLEAFNAYALKYGRDHSAERIAERAGFCYGELVTFLGREPRTWVPR